MLINHPEFYVGTTEVHIFSINTQVPGENFVARCFQGVGVLGDIVMAESPTDDELHAAFGQEVSIHRGYQGYVSNALIKMMAEKIKERFGPFGAE